jgi:nucleotide-binding universal stress UspA family protein
MTTKIVVGVDGSEHSTRALEWCARYAKPLGAEVVVVHAIEIPIYPAIGLGSAYMPIPATSEQNPAELEDHISREWCAPLTKAEVPFRVVCTMGVPSVVVMQVAAREDADLVVAGRRGRGGFAELLLGSTSHQLSHHLDRPLVIVP